MDKSFWTFAAGDDGIVTARAHANADEAACHYAMMRTVGGPKHIGKTNVPLSRADVIRFLTDRFSTVEIANPVTA